MSYTPYATSPRGKNGNIIMLPQFEEVNLLFETRNLLSETHDNTEISNKSDDNSNMLSLII